MLGAGRSVTFKGSSTTKEICEKCLARLRALLGNCPEYTNVV